jgi:hypothetical protein
VTDDSCPVQDEHGAGKPGGIQRWLGGAFNLASGQEYGSYLDGHPGRGRLPPR